MSAISILRRWSAATLVLGAGALITFPGVAAAEHDPGAGSAESPTVVVREVPAAVDRGPDVTQLGLGALGGVVLTGAATAAVMTRRRAAAKPA